MQESATFAEPEAAPGSTGGRGHRRARQAVLAGVGAIVVVVGLFALADDVDAPTTTKAIGTSVTSTTKPDETTTTTVAVVAPTDDPAATTTTSTTRGAQVLFPVPNQEVVPSPADPAPEPPPPPAPTASISANPATPPRSSAYFTLSWGSTNAVSVTVSGPNFSSSQPSGSQPRVCAGAPIRTSPCVLMAPVTYTITARNSAGQTVTRSVTVSPS